MGATNLYYLNGPDLSSATSVFTDIFLTVLAPDGWYSAGGVVREQVGGVLQSAGACTSCGFPCTPSPATLTFTDSSAVDKEIILPMSVGNGVGCVRIDMVPLINDVAFGVKAYFGSVFRNALLENSGTTNGYLQSQTPGQNMTVIYDTFGSCFTPPIPNPFIFEQYKYDSIGNLNATGNTVLYNVLPSDLSGVLLSGQTFTMFMPKITGASDQIDFYMYAFNGYACGVPLDIDITFSCPAPLPMVKIHTITYPDNIAACAYTGDDYQQLFIGYINGSPGSIAINDVLFMDPASYTPFAFPPGWYLYTNALPIVPGSRVAFEVDANGVVINSVACP